MLAKQYSCNWQLVSDLFNSTRLAVPTDRREPWDCYDRFKRIQQSSKDGLTSTPQAQLPTEYSAATEDGAPPVHNNSLISKRDRLNKRITAKHDGSRKKLRRTTLVDLMRRSAKKRDAVQKPSTAMPRKINLASHETHAQLKGGPVATPQQLSNIKAERDQHAVRLYYEQQRLQQLAFQQQQARLQQQQQQQQQQQKQQQTQAPGAGDQRTGTPQPNRPSPAAQPQASAAQAAQQPRPPNAQQSAGNSQQQARGPPQQRQLPTDSAALLALQQQFSQTLTG